MKTMGSSGSKRSLMEEKLGLQKTAVDNLKKAVDETRTKLANANTEKEKLLEAKKLSGLETSLANAELKAIALKNQISAMNYIRYGTMISNFGHAMRTMGRNFSIYIGAPLAALGISSFNAFKDYEMSLARLEAALPDAQEQIEMLNQAALDMSETIPVSYEEIMAIMTSLAKAGVPADKIESMTLTLARMSAVTGMTADEVGTSMVMFMNALGLPMENVDQLGAALVRLADESIATEGDIFSMATRMAATSNLAGLSAVDVLSLASAFASMGVEAQAGGSAASKLMKQMQIASEVGGSAAKEFAKNNITAGMSVREIELKSEDSKWVSNVAKSMGKTKDEVNSMIDALIKLQQFADLTGTSVEGFQQGWSENAANTMLAFFKGLSTVDASNETGVLALLDEMGLTEIRLSNLIALGASNPDMFETLMGTGAAGFEENTALVEKAGIIFETTSGQMDMLSNSVRNAQADMGENVADVFGPIIEKVGDLAEKFNALDEDAQTRWVTVGGILIALGPAASGIGLTATAVGNIAKYIGKIKSGDAAGFTAVMKALTGPIGGWALAGLGLAGIIAAIESIETPSETIIKNLQNIKIELDEESYDQTMAAIAAVRAQTDALAGKTGENNKNISVAVKAGFGTPDMYGTALGYEGAYTQQQIADIAGKYAGPIAELNNAIGAETNRLTQESLARKRDNLQAQWDAEVIAAKNAYMEQVSALVDGMMQSQPEVKSELERAAKDYDLLVALLDAVKFSGDSTDQAAIDQKWAEIFTPEVMNRFFPDMIDLQAGTASFELYDMLIASLNDALQAISGEDSFAYTLWQSILGDPLTSGLFDRTKTQGALDGILEILDFKSAGEQAGLDFWRCPDARAG